MVEEDSAKNIVTGTDQTIECTMTYATLSALDLIWRDPLNNVIPTNSNANYSISETVTTAGDTSTTISILTMKTAVLSQIASPSTFQCQVDSISYPLSSPTTTKNITVSFLILGN